MKVSKAEYLSALVDDETGEFESRRMVEELGKNADDRELWARYHLIGEALRGGLPPVVDRGLAARISQALEDEPALQAPAAAGVAGRRLAKPLVGFAMAAGVAVVSVVSLQTLTVTGTDENDVAPVQMAMEQQPVPGVEPVAATRVATTVPAAPSVPSAEAAARMNSYLVNHAEYGGGRQAMLPQVRIVGYSQSQD